MRDGADDALPVHAVRPAALDAFMATLPASQAGFARQTGFTAKAGQLCLLPGEAGLAGAVLGLGDSAGPDVFGALPAALPAAHVWRWGKGIEDAGEATLGFAMGAYRFDQHKRSPAASAARLVVAEQPGSETHRSLEENLLIARAIWFARDLINTPANHLGPDELAQAACTALAKRGAEVEIIAGPALAVRYPVLELVGRGSARKPCVLLARWRGSAAGEAAPLISLCGKGICFDTGGYDIKPSSGMLKMKKDMGGAAVALALAVMIIEADLSLRLELRLGCAENMISADAMRPLDIVTARNGLSIEIGNTDAEGRLLLCDLLNEAGLAQPQVVMDFATLTGAARVALGPDLPALFTNNEALSRIFLQAGNDCDDPLWRLPLWQGYKSSLESGAADLNNVSVTGHAGAIVAALFLEHFVPAGIAWAHFDIYCWNDSARPGHPAGGEAGAVRAVFLGLKRFLGHETESEGEADSG